jgi:hypothetical protein
MEEYVYFSRQTRLAYHNHKPLLPSLEEGIDAALGLPRCL